MDLLALEDFNLVARHGGFGRAARATGRAKTTLSRRVTELEADLGIRLFERGTREPRLTEEGRALHERTSALLTEIDEVVSSIVSGAQRPRGSLRISVPVLFGQTIMGRLTSGFLKRYPEVRLEVTAEDRAVDLVEEGYDLVIRVNPSPAVSLVGRCFFRDTLVIAAVPRLAPPEIDKPVPSIVLGSLPARPWRVRLHGEERAIEHRPVLSLSSWAMVRDAVRAGAGAALMPRSVVSADFAAGRLVNWGEAIEADVELWALYPSRRLLNSRVSAFMQYLTRVYARSGRPD